MQEGVEARSRAWGKGHPLGRSRNTSSGQGQCQPETARWGRQVLSPEQHWAGGYLWAHRASPCQVPTVPLQNPPLWFPPSLGNEPKSHAVPSWTWSQSLGPDFSQAQVWHLGPAGSFPGPVPYLSQACYPFPTQYPDWRPQAPSLPDAWGPAYPSSPP